MPVLAEETVKGTSLVEDGQVFIAVFGALRMGKLGIASAGAAGTDPVSHTIGGQRIIIPADVSLFCSGADKLIPLVGAEATVSPAAGRDAALVGAELAANAHHILRRLLGKMERAPGSAVGLFDQRQNLGEILADAIHTQPQSPGDED